MNNQNYRGRLLTSKTEAKFQGPIVLLRTVERVDNVRDVLVGVICGCWSWRSWRRGGVRMLERLSLGWPRTRRRARGCRRRWARRHCDCLPRPWARGRRHRACRHGDCRRRHWGCRRRGGVRMLVRLGLVRLVRLRGTVCVSACRRTWRLRCHIVRRARGHIDSRYGRRTASLRRHRGWRDGGGLGHSDCGVLGSLCSVMPGGLRHGHRRGWRVVGELGHSDCGERGSLCSVVPGGLRHSHSRDWHLRG